MAGTTEHYGLTIWGREDEFKAPEGLNGNFEAVEEALAGLQGQIDGKDVIFGSYSGSGVYPRTIELGFRPKAVLLVSSFGGMHSGSYYYGGLFSLGFPIQTSSTLFAETVQNGFCLTMDTTNRSSTQYYYLAFK